MSKVCVLLPVYNAEQNIRRALDSVLNQDLEDFKLLISDNNSTDSTPEVVSQYAARDSRIVLNHTGTNIGRVPNWNRMLDMAAEQDCNYLKPLMVNDYLLPGCLSDMVATMEANPGVSILRSSVSCLNDAGKVVYCPYIDSSVRWSGDYALSTAFDRVGGIVAGPSSWMLDANIIREHHIRFDERLTSSADYEFGMQLFRHGDFYYLRRQLFVFDLVSPRHFNLADVVATFLDEATVRIMVYYDYGFAPSEDHKLQLASTLERVYKSYREMLNGANEIELYGAYQLSLTVLHTGDVSMILGHK